MSRCSLYLFGSPRLEVNGQPVNTDRRKALALLAYLAVTSKPHTREALAALLWPDYEPGKAFAYLRRTLWELSQLLGEGVVLAERESVELNPQAEMWLDVAEFRRCLTVARSVPSDRQATMLRAVEWYQADFLSNFRLKDAPDFDEWQFLEAENLRRDLAAVLRTLVELDLADGGEPERAINLARRWLALDSFDEAAHRTLMRAYAQAGQTAAAIHQYQECVRILQAELKIAPQPETAALFEQIKSGPRTANGRPGETAPARPSHTAATITNLPRALAPFIGRAQLLADLAERLTRQGDRLITLVGSGGVGKTRLALEVAHAVQAHYAHGAWFIDLAPLSDPLLVPQAVVTALEIYRVPDRPALKDLSERLRDKRILLVLDNCEHLIDACAQLADHLLQHCPELHLLATSREALGIQGEASVRVPSLSLPAIGQPSPEVLAQSEAVQLFLDRATAASSDFALTAANVPAVMQICRRLDGIALAIELAASRVKVLKSEQIAARLDDAFHLLTGGSRTALPRQQTLMATIDWSYNLLTDHERTLLRRLAVFVGGWTLEAAEAIGAGDDLERYDILDLLTQLVNKSLVIVEQPQTEEARYRLLDTIHQYAREKLAATTEFAAIRQRHLLFYLQLAERAEPELQRPAQAAWFNRLEMEYDNLRAALDWACLTNAKAGLRLGSALRDFWTVRGYWTEGREWLTRILALPAAQGRTTSRAGALNGAAYLAHMQGDAPEAEHLYEESIAIWREGGDTGEGIMHALRVYGNSVHFNHDRARGRALIEESLAIARTAGNQVEMAWSLFDLGLITEVEDQHDAARALLEESLALHRAVQNPVGLGLALNWLGEDALEHGEPERARALLEECQQFYRLVRDKRGMAASSASLAREAWLQNDLPRAMQLAAESLALAREIGLTDLTAGVLGGLGWMALQQKSALRAKQCLAEALGLLHGSRRQDEVFFCLIGMAGVAAAQGQFERAATLLGKVNLRDMPPWPPIVPDIERLLVELHARLSEAEFAAAWSKGRALSDEQAIAYALNTGAGAS